MKTNQSIHRRPLEKFKHVFFLLASWLLPQQRKLHRKWRKSIKERRNQIILINEHGEKRFLSPFDVNRKWRLILDGHDNIIIFHAPVLIENLCLSILPEAHHNYLEFFSPPSSDALNIQINVVGINGSLVIEGGTRFGGGGAIILCSGKLHVGKNCMFSSDTTIWTHDSHSLIDATTGELLNGEAKGIDIGDHCWIGQGVTLTKNAVLPPHTVVGLKSIVTRPFTEEYTVITGCPARVVRKNVSWSRTREWEYVYKTD